MSYSEIIKRSEKKKILSINKIDDLLNNGYSIIYYDTNNNNKIKIIYSKNYENINRMNIIKNNKKIINKMINNWNDFRNEDIEYYGTRSIYYNYENIIENIINENNKINEEIYNRIYNLDLTNSDINSDNEDL